LGSPERWLERCPELVDSQSMIGIVDAPAQFGIVELIPGECHGTQPTKRNAERADGVPHAHEVDRDTLVPADRELFLELRRATVVRSVHAASVERHGSPVLCDGIPPEDATVADHASQA